MTNFVLIWMPSRNSKVLNNARQFLTVWNYLHFALLVPAYKRTVVSPDHCDNQKNPPQTFPNTLSRQYCLYWEPLIYRICSWQISNLWYQGQTQGFVCLSIQWVPLEKSVFEEFFDTVSQHNEGSEDEKYKGNGICFNS